MFLIEKLKSAGVKDRPTFRSQKIPAEPMTAGIPKFEVNGRHHRPELRGSYKVPVSTEVPWAMARSLRDGKKG